jgi:hypothetical protein
VRKDGAVATAWAAPPRSGRRTRSTLLKRSKA